MAWHVEPGHDQPNVSSTLITSFEKDQVKGWDEWFRDHYPGYRVDAFRILGITYVAGQRILEWALIVTGKKEKRQAAFMHGEDADLDLMTMRPNFPHSDSDILDHLEVMLDGGPGGMMIEVDMAEEFGVDLMPGPTSRRE
jgi:hypothetical protein